MAVLVWSFTAVALVQLPAQVSPPAPSSTPPAAAAPNSQPTRPVTISPISQIKKMVAFLTVTYQTPIGIMQKRGTSFFVAYEDKRLGPGQGFVYLVTNRHMVQPGFEDGAPFAVTNFSLKLNKRSLDGTSTAFEAMLPINSSHWYFRDDDPSVDLAVLPLAPDQAIYDYSAFPTSLMATRDVVQSQSIAEGDSILFAGFFYQFSGLKKNEPIVREGVLAMMPEEKMTTTMHKPGDLYLADVHVFNGNSGSPMFVNVGGLHNGALTFGGFPFRLLGVVSGYMNESEKFEIEVSPTLPESSKENSGISTVIPVDELKDLLDTAPLQQMRDSFVAKMPIRQ
ncbi:trypsin-like peptidase domain-containing protein [Tunturiibacter psychrotolerans]|uniref:trypsin-like peptidase domain-containing protein n=1 Tax=Tunturiibacter psychrotolerans TaxID=3069686 RepID=UPI003D1F6E71